MNSNTTPKTVCACAKHMLKTDRWGRREICNCDRNHKRRWRNWRMHARITGGTVYGPKHTPKIHKTFDRETPEAR